MLTHATLVRLCQARERLRDDVDDPSVAALAREAGMSTYHFIRRFAAVFGETPHQHRIAARLERARRLLARGEHSVTEVCFELGFSSLGSFSDLFTRRVGVSPSRYRRQARTTVQVPGVRQPVLFPGCLLLMCGPAALQIANSEKTARAIA
ncbi:helix-turn-helix domain-containing protein [Nannocystis exedens]|nr:AraC family transcriptional regulator [Nannocystis exedens]